MTIQSEKDVLKFGQNGNPDEEGFLVELNAQGRLGSQFLPTGIGTGTGAVGITGPEGPTGPRGVTGPDGGGTGPQGPTGFPGSGGIQGETGPQGASGQSITGPVGPTGPSGSQGITGPQGVEGDPSGIGPTGQNGIQGETGPQGLVGDQGSIGPGITGPQGVTGVEGLQSSGPQGATGETGPQGPTGPRGQRGNPSSLGFVSVSTSLPQADFLDVAEAISFGARNIYIIGTCTEDSNVAVPAGGIHIIINTNATYSLGNFQFTYSGDEDVQIDGPGQMNYAYITGQPLFDQTNASTVRLGKNLRLTNNSGITDTRIIESGNIVTDNVTISLPDVTNAGITIDSTSVGVSSINNTVLIGQGVNTSRCLEYINTGVNTTRLNISNLTLQGIYSSSLRSIDIQGYALVSNIALADSVSNAPVLNFACTLNGVINDSSNSLEIQLNNDEIPFDTIVSNLGIGSGSGVDIDLNFTTSGTDFLIQIDNSVANTFGTIGPEGRFFIDNCTIASGLQIDASRARVTNIHCMTVTIAGDSNLVSGINGSTFSVTGDLNRLTGCIATGQIAINGDDNSIIGSVSTTDTVRIQSGNRNIVLGNSTNLTIVDSGASSEISTNGEF